MSPSGICSLRFLHAGALAPTVADNFFRLMRLLQLVPRAPKFIDTEQLETILSNEGTDSTRRTIQRDLIKLESMGFGLECLDDSKPYRWRFSEKADVVLLPGLDPQAALALRLVELHLERMLPKATLRALQPHLQAARKALDGKPVAKWLEKVRLISRSQPLLPPRIDGSITGVVHEALLEGKQIEAKYKGRGSEMAKDMTLHPLGLVHRDSVAYLVATAFEYTDARLYPLHRFLDAKMSQLKARPLAGFSLDAFIAEGELGYKIGKEEIEVELLFEKDAGQGLEETPLSADQKVTKREDGSVLVKARVPDTQVLRSWILGFASSVEVVKPRALRVAVARAHEAAVEVYASNER